jgi:hypothetical protein
VLEEHRLARRRHIDRKRASAVQQAEAERLVVGRHVEAEDLLDVFVAQQEDRAVRTRAADGRDKRTVDSFAEHLDLGDAVVFGGEDGVMRGGDDEGWSCRGQRVGLHDLKRILPLR